LVAKFVEQKRKKEMVHTIALELQVPWKGFAQEVFKEKLK